MSQLSSFLMSFVAFFLIINNPLANASTLLDAGIYTGSVMTTGGRQIPLALSLSYTDEEVPGNSDDILPFKRKIIGSFVINEEGGPYTFANVDYDIETSRIDLRYNRPLMSMVTPQPSLRFLGKRQDDGSYQGTVTSGLSGYFGTFNITKSTRFTKLTPTISRFVGHWRGTWTFSYDNHSVPMELFIGSSKTATTINPEDMELHFTPGKLGSLQLDSGDDALNMSFQNIVVDYLRDEMRLTYAASVGSGGQLTLRATVNGDQLSGTATSTYKEVTAQFSAKKEPSKNDNQ